MKYFSMFSGIGGFEKAMEKEHECIGYSEIDRYAKSIYKKHFPEHRNYGDATAIDVSELGDFDLLVAGFPCQAFSIAGKRKGFMDTRGTLFFEIARVLDAKRPRYFLLENVAGLLSHDDRKTFVSIIGVLTDLGYRVQWQLLNSKDYGVPQNRERIFIAGCFGKGSRFKVFPVENGCSEDNRKLGEEVSWCLDANYYKGTNKLQKNNRQLIVENKLSNSNQRNVVYSKEGLSPALNTSQGGGLTPLVNENDFAIPVLTPDREKKRQHGRRFKEDGEPAFTLTGQDKHGVAISQGIRRLTPTECERLQGFPDGWTEYGHDGNKISDTQRYKCLGNAVSVPVIERIMKNFINNGGV